MKNKSTIKPVVQVLKNRRLKKSRCLNSERIKPLQINFIQVKKESKIFGNAGLILKESDIRNSISEHVLIDNAHDS